MPPGRRSKLDTDPEIVGRITAMLRAGMFPERAALAVGISESTHYLWLQKGREELTHREGNGRPRKTWEKYVNYLLEVEQATAEAEMIAVGKIASGESGWQAQAWLLSRRFRERWSTKAQPAPANVPPADDDTERPAGTDATVTALDKFTQRREQRRGTQA